jgi:hypothetical protein
VESGPVETRCIPSFPEEAGFEHEFRICECLFQLGQSKNLQRYYHASHLPNPLFDMRKHNYPNRIVECMEKLSPSSDMFRHFRRLWPKKSNMIRDLVVALSLGELEEAKRAWPKGEPEGQA